WENCTLTESGYLFAPSPVHHSALHGHQRTFAAGAGRADKRQPVSYQPRRLLSCRRQRNLLNTNPGSRCADRRSIEARTLDGAQPCVTNTVTSLLPLRMTVRRQLGSALWPALSSTTIVLVHGV